MSMKYAKGAPPEPNDQAEIEGDNSPTPDDDQADDHEDNDREDQPYLRLSDDDPLTWTRQNPGRKSELGNDSPSIMLASLSVPTTRRRSPWLA